MTETSNRFSIKRAIGTNDAAGAVLLRAARVEHHAARSGRLGDLDVVKRAV